jgi:hypothetical protein
MKLYEVIAHKVWWNTFTSDLIDFHNQIDAAVASGWQLQGGVSITQCNGFFLFAQAIVKVE